MIMNNLKKCCNNSFFLLIIFFWAATLSAQSTVDGKDKSSGGNRAYIIKVTGNELLIDKVSNRDNIGKKFEIFQPGEKIVHPVTKEVIEIDTLIGEAILKDVKANYSILTVSSDIVSQIKTGQYLLLDSNTMAREEELYRSLYQNENNKFIPKPNLINISNRSFYFNQDDLFIISRLYYQRETRIINTNMGLALDFISFGFQGGYGKTIANICNTLPPSSPLVISQDCKGAKLKPNFLQGFFETGIRLGEWLLVYMGNGIGLGDTEGANWGFIFGGVIGNKKSVYLDVGYYRFADFIRYTTFEFTAKVASKAAITMEFGYQLFPSRTVATKPYGMFQLGGKVYLGDTLYIKMLAGASGISTKRLGPLATLETGVLF